MVSCYAVEDQTSYEDMVLRPPGTPQLIHASLPSASTNLAQRPTFEYITNSFGKFDTPSFPYITNSYGNTNYGSLKIIFWKLKKISLFINSTFIQSKRSVRFKAIFKPLLQFFYPFYESLFEIKFFIWIER
jgi:hypothetical protein